MLAHNHICSINFYAEKFCWDRQTIKILILLCVFNRKEPLENHRYWRCCWSHCWVVYSSLEVDQGRRGVREDPHLHCREEAR